MTAPLMPKATAVWLVDNTNLTFRQIAVFCELHELEIQAIADGDVAYNIIGISPVANGQLSQEEISRCENDPSANLVANVMEKNVKEINAKNKRVLSPSQREDKPSAILWIVRNCPELSDQQICKLIGTTKPTIAGIREGTRADFASLRSKNPVAVGLCSEQDLDLAIKTAKEKIEKKEQAAAQKALKAEKTKKAAPKAKPAKKKTAKKASVKTAKAKKKAVKKTEKKTTQKAAKKTEKKAPEKAVKKIEKKTTKKASAKKASASK